MENERKPRESHVLKIMQCIISIRFIPHSQLVAFSRVLRIVRTKRVGGHAISVYSRACEHARVCFTRLCSFAWKFYLEFFPFLLSPFFFSFFAAPSWIEFPRGLITRATQRFSWRCAAGIQPAWTHARTTLCPPPWLIITWPLILRNGAASGPWFQRTVMPDFRYVFYPVEKKNTWGKNNCNRTLSAVRLLSRNPQIFYINARDASAESFIT